jgi:hypothetical protein
VWCGKASHPKNTRFVGTRVFRYNISSGSGRAKKASEDFVGSDDNVPPSHILHVAPGMERDSLTGCIPFDWALQWHRYGYGNV